MRGEEFLSSFFCLQDNSGIVNSLRKEKKVVTLIDRSIPIREIRKVDCVDSSTRKKVTCYRLMTHSSSDIIKFSSEDFFRSKEF